MHKEFLDPPAFWGWGFPKKYLGKSFHDGMVSVSVFFDRHMPSLKNIDPRIVPYLYDSYEEAYNNPIIAPRFKHPDFEPGPGERKVFVQSHPCGDTVVQIIGKSTIDEVVKAAVLLVGLFELRVISIIEMPLRDFNEYYLFSIEDRGISWEVRSVPSTKAEKEFINSFFPPPPPKRQEKQEEVKKKPCRCGSCHWAEICYKDFCPTYGCDYCSCPNYRPYGSTL
jgi:hypothetical protein